MAMEEIKIVFGCVRRRWDETIIAEATIPGDESDPSADRVDGKRITIKGKMAEEDDPNAGDLDRMASHGAYLVYGQWKQTKYGQQFHFQTFTPTAPHGRTGVIKYLQQAPGVGQATAEMLWKKFRGDAVRVLRESPEVASAAANRFSVEKAAKAADFLRGIQRLEAITIEMFDLLSARGFPRKTAKSCISRWGNVAPLLIRHNPYLLMHFRGCGFLSTDKMYLELGHPPHKLKRQALCAWHAIAQHTAKTGNTWSMVDVAAEGIKSSVSGAQLRDVEALQLAKRAKLLAFRWEESPEHWEGVDEHRTLWVAEYVKAEQERKLAAKIAEALAEPSHWPLADEVEDISDHQRGALRLALSGGPLAIIGGTPGTGKTYLAAQLVKTLIRKYGAGSIAVAAPTGKAAVRIGESLRACGVGLPASTEHRLLVVESSEDGWSFKHRESNPLPFRFVLFDEQSMKDVPLSLAAMNARDKGTHYIFVGDIGQLPPVGHGAPLRDMIRFGVPYAELTKIRRNSGMGVLACKHIRAGEGFEACDVLEPESGANLKLIPASKAGAANAIVDLCVKIRDSEVVSDPIWDVQVVIAVNKRSPLARRTMNVKLQAELNPHGQGADGSPFRVGDKAICLSNGFYQMTEDFRRWLVMECRSDDSGNFTRYYLPDGDTLLVDQKNCVFIANGEQGKVLEAFSNRTVFGMTSPRREVLIPRGSAKQNEPEQQADSDDGDGAGCDWDLAYAVTCHKGQGSQWPIVVVALDEYPGATGSRGICSREWLYTAISRFETACFLVGKMTTALSMIRRVALEERKTFLVERIAEEAEQMGIDLSPPDRTKLIEQNV